MKIFKKWSKSLSVSHDLLNKLQVSLEADMTLTRTLRHLLIQAVYDEAKMYNYYPHTIPGAYAELVDFVLETYPQLKSEKNLDLPEIKVNDQIC